MNALLEADGIVVELPPRSWLAGWASKRPRILDGVSINVRHGEIVGVIGESGSGKTTLARALVGLVPRAAGTIRFAGQAVGVRDPGGWRRLRRDTAMLFQDPIGSLSPRVKVGFLVTEPLVVHGLPMPDRRAKARELLEQLGLPAAMAERYPHELSGGQARRVGVARALALGPKLVIADEPTAGLDVSVQGGVLNLMLELQARLGLGYVLITHNLAAVRRVADRLVILYLGRVVEEGPTEALLERPRHPYTASLIAASRAPDPRRRRNEPPVRGETPSLYQRPTGCEFHDRCSRVRARCHADAPVLDPVAAEGPRVRCHFPLH